MPHSVAIRKIRSCTSVKGMTDKSMTPNCTDYLKIVDGFKDGKPIKFFIKQIPKDRYEDAVNHMCTYFLADEFMCKSENLKDDPEAVQEFREIFEAAIQSDLSVGAFVENPDNEKSIIAGLNILYLGGENSTFDVMKIMTNLKSDLNRRIMQVMEETTVDAEVKEIYGVNRYLGGFGLSVDPIYRGNAIGYHLLLAREDIGRKYDIPTTITVFTSPIAAKLAARAGFTVLKEKLRDELVDDQGKMLLPKCKATSFKCMGRKLP